MAQQTISLTQTSSRSVSQLFTLLADHQQLAQVLGVPVARVRDGQETLNGVGSVRRIGPPIIGVEETVTAMETDRFIEYRISRNGGPIRNHRGRLDFSENAGGSQVHWQIEFDAPLPLMGQGIAAGLKFALGRGLKRIA